MGQYGCYTDGTTGLVYCQHRYYDPNVGRWTSRDPSGLSGGVNVYQFVDGDPILGVDPTGLDPEDIRLAKIFGDNTGAARPCKLIYHPSIMTAWSGVSMTVDEYDDMNGPLLKAILTGNAYNSVLVIGHGDKGYLYYNVPMDTMFEAKDLYKFAAIRKKNHLPKLKSIDLEECYVCMDHNLVNALLELAENVYGFEGETVNPNTLALGVRYHYTKPFVNVSKVAEVDRVRNYKKKGHPPQ